MSNSRQVLARSANELLIHDASGAYIIIKTKTITEGYAYTQPKHYDGSVQRVFQDVNKALANFNNR